jgi:tight adherence protein B
MRGRSLRMTRRALVLAVASIAIVVIPTAAARVRIQAVDTSGFPALRAIVIAPRGSAAPRLHENGAPAAGVVAVNLGRSKTIVLAIDRSESMRGRPLRNALAAAGGFVRAANASDHVGVVAFGRSAIPVSGATGGPGDADTALAAITVDTRSGTALYDAVVIASTELRTDDRPGRALVVVTDGKDVSSLHSLDEAIAAAQRAHASVYAIGIAGPSFTPDALERIAQDTGGTYRQAANPGQLAAVYASLQNELARTWQVTYDTASRPGSKLRLNATVPGAGSATAAVALPAAGGAAADTAASSLIPSAGYSLAGTLLVSVAAGLLVLLACSFWFAAREGTWLKSRLAPHLGIVREVGKTHRRATRKQARGRTVDAIEGALVNLKQFRAVQRMIERADLPLRAGELLAMCTGAAFFVGLVVAVAAASPLLALVAMAIGFLLPLGFVRFKANSRLKRFENQLPDLLITIAASLKAGHSFRQGVQSAVEEGAEPAAKEFKRVLTETQLGKPMDEALGDMATRVGSKNFSFVITAVTIQRQIGGSLAGLFDMVAETVRQRQQFARKIRGLTAMGRMAAYTLVGLPFFIAGAASVINPTFMSPLYDTGTGHMLIASGLVMMAIGSLMLKKIVSFRG